MLLERGDAGGRVDDQALVVRVPGVRRPGGGPQQVLPAAGGRTRRQTPASWPWPSRRAGTANAPPGSGWPRTAARPQPVRHEPVCTGPTSTLSGEPSSGPSDRAWRAASDTAWPRPHRCHALGPPRSPARVPNGSGPAATTAVRPAPAPAGPPGSARRAAYASRVPGAVRPPHPARRLSVRSGHEDNFEFCGGGFLQPGVTQPRTASSLACRAVPGALISEDTEQADDLAVAVRGVVVLLAGRSVDPLVPEAVWG